MNTIKLNTIGEAPIKKSGASGGGGNYVYFDISGLSDGDKEAFFSFASLAKLLQDGSVAVIPMALSLLMKSPTSSYLALAVDESAKILMNGEYATIGEMLSTGSGPALPSRITEEEFYEGKVESPSDEH